MASKSQGQNGENPSSNGTKNGAGVTFAAQDRLPKLPIPKLEDSLKKYREVLRPLQTKNEQADTAVVTEEFLRRDGPELDSRLRKYATGKTSYIEQFCGCSETPL